MKMILNGILTTIALAVLGGFSHAQQLPERLTVQTTDAAVFSGPADHYYIAAELPSGTEVEVYERLPNGMVAIRPPAGSFSWIPASAAEMVDRQTAIISQDQVPSRIGSLLNNRRDAVLVQLSLGERVRVLAIKTIGDKEWLQIAPPAGEFRWMRGEALASAVVPAKPPAKVVEAPIVIPQQAAALPQSVEQPLASRLVNPVLATPAEQPSIPEPAAFEAPRESPTEPAATGGWVKLSAERATQQKVDEKVAIVRYDDPPAAATKQAFQAPPLAEVTNQTPAPAPSQQLAQKPAKQAAQTMAPPQATSQPQFQSPQVLTGQAQNSTPSAPVVAGKTNLFARQLADLDVTLSRRVTESPNLWQLDDVEQQAAKLLTTAKTPQEQAAVRALAGRVDRFARIANRYKALRRTQPRTAPATTPSTVPSTVVAQTPPAANPSRLPTTSVASAKELSPAAEATDSPVSEFDAEGLLRPVVSKRDNAPKYALVDPQGKIVTFLTPSPDLNLQPMLGKRIGVRGARGYMPEYRHAHVTAQRATALPPVRR